MPDTQWCGHPVTSIVELDDGTRYCRDCVRMPVAVRVQIIAWQAWKAKHGKGWESLKRFRAAMAQEARDARTTDPDA